MFESIWEKAMVSKEIRPVFIEVAKQVTSLTPEQRHALLEESANDPTFAVDVLNKHAECFLGQPVPKGAVITWPEELIEATYGFMCDIIEGDNAEKILAVENQK